MDCTSPPPTSSMQQHAGAWPQSDPSDMRTTHMSEPQLGASALSHPATSQLQSASSMRAHGVHGSLIAHGGISLAAGMGGDSSMAVLVPGAAARRVDSTSPPPAQSSASGLTGAYSSAFRRYTDQDPGDQGPQQYQPHPPLQPPQGAVPQPAPPAPAVVVAAANAARSRGAAVVNKATTGLVATYSASSQELSPPAPRRSLTKPSDGVKNDGYDNENSDLILRVGDVLLNHNPTHGITRKYTIQHMLGQGTFGQVASCWSDEMQRNVAVKVIKNQPAYFHQARVEIGLLNLLNTRCDPHDERHIVRMLDSFLFRKHLCIVFEKLDVNLFELLKRNAFKGLSLPTVQSLLRQLLDSLMVLRDSSIMHCDLKPENILLKTMGSDEIKLIDFGSACFENRVVYSYIQSRFYRSPEVVLGTSYNVAIDMWSLGCVAAELFLGLPLFPGASEHDLMVRIVETLGTPPAWLLVEAKHTERYFKRITVMPHGTQQLPLASPSLMASSLSSGGLGPYDLASSVPRYQHQHLAQLAAQQQQRQAGSSMGQSGGSVSSWVLLSQPEFETRNACKAPVGKRYFMHTQLADIIAAYPMRPGLQDDEMNGERVAREAFIDFLLGVLDLDPRTRWTPRQAAAHPFITGAAFTGPFQPPQDAKSPMRPLNPGLNSSGSHPQPVPQVPTSAAAAAATTAIPVAVSQHQATPGAVVSGFGGAGPSGVPQASLLGSFQTSFVMGTPHKRVAPNRASPVPPVPQVQQQQQGLLSQQQGSGAAGQQHVVLPPSQQQTGQAGWGGMGSGSVAGAQDAGTWPQQAPGGMTSGQSHAMMAGGQMGQGGGGFSHSGAAGGLSQLGQSGGLSQLGQAGGLSQQDANSMLGASEAAHAAAAAAARALAFAAFQQLPPQMLSSAGMQGYGGMPIPGLQQQPGLGSSSQFGGPSDMQTEQQQGGLMNNARQGPQQQGSIGGPSSSQALANIILGSTPSTPHLPPNAWGPNRAGGMAGVGASAGGAGSAAGGALSQLALQQQLSQGLLSGMMSSADMQNVATMAAMAAVRQAAAQLQQQQQAAGMTMGLTQPQLMYLRQQQQAVAAAVAAGGAQLNSLAAAAAAGYGLGSGLGWGQQPAPQQQQQGSMAGWPSGQTSSSHMHASGHMSGNMQHAGHQAQPQQFHSTPAHMRRSSFATMVEDSESPVMFANNMGPNGGGGDPSSSQGTGAAGPAGGASPSDWDPSPWEGDFESMADGPGSPVPAPGTARGRTTGSGRATGGRALSSRASSGHDGAVAGGGTRSGMVVNSGMAGGRHASAGQQQQGAVDMMGGSGIAAMIANQQAQLGMQGHLQQQLGMHAQVPLMGSGGYMPYQQQFGMQGGGVLMPQGVGAQGTLPMDMLMDHQAVGGWLQQQQQQAQQLQPHTFGGLLGATGPMATPGMQQGATSSSSDPSQVVGSLPFSGMGAAPAMHMYQVLLAQQQQRQQQQNAAVAAQHAELASYASADHSGHG